MQLRRAIIGPKVANPTAPPGQELDQVDRHAGADRDQQRGRRAHAETPRRLRRIVLTLPTGMPLAERLIFRKRAEAARDLVWMMMGWKLDDPAAVPAGTQGSVALPGTPKGKKMGVVRARRGHMTLLPAGAAYQFHAARPGVVLLQTLAGRDTVERWADICQTTPRPQA